MEDVCERDCKKSSESKYPEAYDEENVFHQLCKRQTLAWFILLLKYNSLQLHAAVHCTEYVIILF